MLGLHRLHIDTDVLNSLPGQDPELGQTLALLANHPLTDLVAIDVALERPDPDRLVASGGLIARQLERSGLFSVVGNREMAAFLPVLATDISHQLPLLFSAAELEKRITPLLTPQALERRLEQLQRQLATMEGIGRFRFMAADPLGLKDLVLARAALLAPAGGGRWYRGQLLSADGRHLLITARPRWPGTDTDAARRIEGLLTALQQQSDQQPSGTAGIRLTPVGTYRAALDNERLIRHDVQLALLLATGGIILLLLFSFPRPWLGLLSLLPSLAGISVALLVYSLFSRSLSLIVLGFGGALISITVDHGITYILFLDQPRPTRGQVAAREVRAIGLLAVLTTIGAFLALSLGAFPLFSQLGRFTALGVLFSFLFVHLVFPQVFRSLPPARKRLLPVRILGDRLADLGWPGTVLALGLLLGLLPFARPRFHISLESMNVVSRATMEADARFTGIWGNPANRVFLMHDHASLAHLQQANDQLLAHLTRDEDHGVLAAGFVPSMLYPGPDLARKNLAAWHAFWTRERVEKLRRQFHRLALKYGFRPEGFAPFFALLAPDWQSAPLPIPEAGFRMLAIGYDAASGRYTQYISATPAERYRSADFLARYRSMARVFDGNHFSQRLAGLLFSTFTTILLVVGLGVALLLLLAFLDPWLTLITLMPVIFSYVCTLGTLHLLGRSIDIPGLMLSVVILGMGIDYGIYLVRVHQRYQDPGHAAVSLARSGVQLAAASTLIGFGVLALARHGLLRSLGVTSLLGIGYSLAGAFLVLPPLLAWYFRKPDQAVACDREASIEVRVRRRYRRMEAYPRMFARCKLRFDPLFADLEKMVTYVASPVTTILDIGCGFGVPACWCLEYFPGAHVHGLDPDPERVRVAAQAAGQDGSMEVGQAPALPACPDQADLILMLDMLHYLDDTTVTSLLANCAGVQAGDGILVIRSVLPVKAPSWSWRLEDYRIRFHGGHATYRTMEELVALVTAADLQVRYGDLSAGNRELFWLVAGKKHRIAG